VRILLLVLALAGLQDAPSDLIRRLRSDRAEERDDAAKKLADLGNAAREALESARRDKDEEVSRRAAEILQTIDRRKREGEHRKPGRLRSAILKEAPLEAAAQEVFGKFGVEFNIEPFGVNLRTLVNLELKDAGFWEAVDLFCQTAGVRVEPHMLGMRCITLPISRSLPWPVSFETIGDARIFAKLVVMGGGGANHGDVTVHLEAAFAPWAVPKRARIEEVKIAGQSVEEDAFSREFRGNNGNLPGKKDLLTVTDLWRGGDGVKRASLKEAATVNVDGTLVLTREEGKGTVEWKLPFSVRGLRVPPAPDR